MAIRTETDPEAGIRRHVVTGPLTRSEALDTLEAAYAQPELQGLSSLWDFRAGSIELTSAEMRQIADVVGRKWQPPRPVRAALVVAQDVDFGMLRMLEMLLDSRSPQEVMVFRDIDAAEAWLKEGGADL